MSHMKPRLSGRVRARGGVFSLPFVCVEEERERERERERESAQACVFGDTHGVAGHGFGIPEPTGLPLRAHRASQPSLRSSEGPKLETTRDPSPRPRSLGSAASGTGHFKLSSDTPRTAKHSVCRASTAHLSDLLAGSIVLRLPDWSRI